MGRFPYIGLTEIMISSTCKVHLLCAMLPRAGQLLLDIALDLLSKMTRSQTRAKDEWLREKIPLNWNLRPL